MLGVCTAFYGFLNLNFFEELLPYSCFVSIYLDYGLRVYPFLLVVITYVILEARGRNFKPVTICCRPFEKLTRRLGRSGDSRHSVLNVFVTFIVLTYAEFAAISGRILQFVTLYTPNGTALPHLYSYYEPSVRYFHGEHFPPALVAIFLIPLFLIPVPLLLFLYPFKWFQKSLEKLRQKQQGLRAFMDIFQGHLKDGTEGSWDWRYFSAGYFLTRLLMGAEFFVLNQWAVYTPLIVLLIIAIGRPYKKSLLNEVECSIFAYYTAVLYTINTYLKPLPNFSTFTLVVVYLLYTLPGVCFVLYCVALPLIKRIRHKPVEVEEPAHGEEDLPDRMRNSGFYGTIEFTQRQIQPQMRSDGT